VGIVRITGNPAYAAAVIWALLALVAKNAEGAFLVAGAAGGVALALAVVLWQRLRA